MKINGKWKKMDNLSEKLVKISQALLAWLIFVILFPFLLIIFGSLFVWKYGVLWIIVNIFKRKFIKSFDDSEAFFAVDRFWENSRSSLGLIVELEGSINVDVVSKPYFMINNQSDYLYRKNSFQFCSFFQVSGWLQKEHLGLPQFQHFSSFTSRNRRFLLCIKALRQTYTDPIHFLWLLLLAKSKLLFNTWTHPSN